MATSDSPFWAAVRTVKSGLSGRAGLAQARAAGIRIQDSTWFRMVGEVRSSLSDQINEVTRPLNRRPLSDEIHVMSTAKATGYLQHLDIMVKDRNTGLVSLRPYSLKVRDTLSRATVLKRGLAAFINAINDRPDDYDEQVLGAVYTGTTQMVPR